MQIRPDRRAINWGDLRRVTPLSGVWGLDRGTPVDRYYIERFLDRQRSDIGGHVLEVKDDGYVSRYGQGVTRTDVLDVNPANPRATIVADLTAAAQIASDTFDCIVLTQTLHQIYDIRSALGHVHRITKPGGVVLCTLPAVSRVDAHDEGDGFPEGDFWRFTGPAVSRLFSEFFPSELVGVESHGNVMTCAAFLYGLSSEELSPDELEHVDPWFPLLFCARAVKPPRKDIR